MIVDAHCHAGTGDGLTGPWDTAAPLSTYLRRADAAGIDRTVVFAPLTSDYPRANAEVARLVHGSRGRLTGFAFVSPTADRGHVAEMVHQAVDGWGFRGLKVHWRDGHITREIADVARARALPVIYDPAGDTGTVETVARAYPDVAWIIPHLSSFADDWKAQTAFVDQLVRLPNVFGDTSGVRYFDVLEDAARRAGPGKVIFGTDGPFLHPAVELTKVLALGLDPPARALVLGGNITRLMRGVRRDSHRPVPAAIP
ncbi:amidohydrolase family protein [Georgenia sp. SYP-B2076]|uniref:amidohydrolase family protein n=1 Tax=Georgenia sp. SYP-B2076 TaxID=2495881 RepID=UPI000F8F5BA5|nr:amidohydrolase family protein [Georgenia sp. SYP-B2076]